MPLHREGATWKLTETVTGSIGGTLYPLAQSPHSIWHSNYCTPRLLGHATGVCGGKYCFVWYTITTDSPQNIQESKTVMACFLRDGVHADFFSCFSLVLPAHLVLWWLDTPLFLLVGNSSPFRGACPDLLARFPLPPSLNLRQRLQYHS